MVTSRISGIMNEADSVREMQNPAKDLLLMKVAKDQHEKLSDLEKLKRTKRMKTLLPIIKDIEESLLDYDSTWTPPFICYHLLTTVSNLTMLDGTIASTASTIGYNEDMSQWWMIYEDEDTEEWVRVDFNGHNGEIHLSTSSKEGPSGGWSDVSVANVITMIRSMVENNGYPDPDVI